MTPFASAMQISVRRSSRASARRERTSVFAPSSRRSRTALAWRTRRALTRERISISTSENALSMRRSASRAARRSWTNHVTAIETAKARTMLSASLRFRLRRAVISPSPPQ